MSGICGWVGPAPQQTLAAMLAAIPYRGDSTDTLYTPGMALGYRWWQGRPGKSPSLFRSEFHQAACAGTLAPSVSFPAEELVARLQAGSLAALDGAFAMAWWDADRQSLTLIRDPFGVRSLYYTTHAGVFYFASELKQLLAIPDLPVDLDDAAIHKYLTFSFVPGEAVPIHGIKRLLPGHTLTWQAGRVETNRYFQLQESLNPAFADQAEAVRYIRRLCKQAVRDRLNGESEVGLYLSGGIDSAAVAVWLQKAGVNIRAFSLDFGEGSVEKEQADVVARTLGIPLSFLPVGGADLAPVLLDLVWKLDLPFGDAVTGPHYLLGQAARQAGLSAVFNGEGGDQLFGGWTSKPMIAAEIYGDMYGEESREEQYLRSYHRFYGLEDELYTPDFRERVGGPGQRRALLQPYLHSEAAGSFLNRVRLADIHLKGSQNILPRAERLANAWALDMRVPFFDRALAEASFQLPPQLKLHGACEKYILKLIMQPHLPDEIVWRRKFGMSVPVTDWILGPLAPVGEELLGVKAVSSRGLFNPDYVERLRQGQDEPGETRRRRLGERLWALLMLEAWLRVFIDGRGRQP